ncbi:hypothetical protein JHK87_019055 [Glycine soja]|nr:hypothetical protein JHK87_019055 [Glycine soja]
MLPDSAQGDLAAVCSWADEVGHTYRYRWCSALHYADTPDFKCNYEYFRDCHDSYRHKHRCVSGAIYNYTMQLKSADASTSSEFNYNLAEALMFLSHFVGDIHQVWDDLIIQSALKTFYDSDLSIMIQAIQRNITYNWPNDVSIWEYCAHNYTACPNRLACKFAYRNATPGSTLEVRLILDHYRSHHSVPIGIGVNVIGNGAPFETSCKSVSGNTFVKEIIGPSSSRIERERCEYEVYLPWIRSEGIPETQFVESQLTPAHILESDSAITGAWEDRDLRAEIVAFDTEPPKLSKYY